MASTAQARLVLVSRRTLPPRESWPSPSPAWDVATLASVSAVQKLEAMGATVLTCAADVTDTQALQAAIRAAETTFGALHGVVPVSYTHLDVYKRQMGEVNQLAAALVGLGLALLAAAWLWRATSKASIVESLERSMVSNQARQDNLESEIEDLRNQVHELREGHIANRALLQEWIAYARRGHVIRAIVPGE